MTYTLPILISIPHSGNKIPQELIVKTLLTTEDIFKDGDSFTNDIYNFKDNVKAFIDTQIARAFIDLNRAPTDRPPENNDGVIKTETIVNVPIYKNGHYPKEMFIEELLQKYYFPYHKRIEQLLQTEDIKLGLDCHSMLSESPPISKIPGVRRPLICLSNGGDEIGMPDEDSDTTTCPAEWIRIIAHCFCKFFGFSKRDVKINEPFKGGYIIHTHSRNKTPWMQIEINRLLFLNKLYNDNSIRAVQQEQIHYLRNTIFKALELFCIKTGIGIL